MLNMAVVILVLFAVLFAFFGIWLLMGHRIDARTRVEMRLKGVKQIKRYELGSATPWRRHARAEDKKREARKNVRRPEGVQRHPRPG